MELLKKSDIRKAIATQRKALIQDERRAKSDLIRELLFSSDEYKASRCVFIYIATIDEVETRKIIKDILKIKNKRVAVPLCNKREKKNDCLRDISMGRIGTRNFRDFGA